jgi:hypothetical protein
MGWGGQCSTRAAPLPALQRLRHSICWAWLPQHAAGPAAPGHCRLLPAAWWGGACATDAGADALGNLGVAVLLSPRLGGCTLRILWGETSAPHSAAARLSLRKSVGGLAPGWYWHRWQQVALSEVCIVSSVA